MENATNATIVLHTSIDSAALLTQGNERLIVCRFKNPARAIAANIPNDAWQQMESAVDNLQYRSLLDAVLIEAAKSILSNYYLNIWDNNKVTVSSIPAHLINADAIIEEASGNNSDWMTKDELTNAWKESATRNAVYNQQRYATDKAYQRAYTRFEEMILKLAGKTSTYQPDELDVILAKIADDDLNTQFGLFVMRRIEALRNKPIKADIDLSVL
jgi:hypothetical protein